MASPPSTEQLAFAKELLAMRSRRRNFVSPDLLGEPAWDMLLALYIACLEQRRSTVLDVAMASGAATTTALRWIDVLQQRGLIRRVRSPLDARVMFVLLEPEGHAQMTAFLEEAARSLSPR